MTKSARLLLVALILFASTSLSCAVAQSVIDRVKSSGPIARLGATEKEPTKRRLNLRPTFTPTPNYTATPTNTPTPTITPIPTDTPTLPPTDTPVPTDTPLPTDTPAPTNTPRPKPPTDTPTPAPTPTPDYPFMVAEQGNRVKTSNTSIWVLVAVIDAKNVPIGGLKIIGNHSPSGKRAESPLSDWRWSAANCLDCKYIKQGNLKFEPGPFEDGTWNIYLADGNGTQVSPVVPLSYSSDPSQWVWDFIIFKKK